MKTMSTHKTISIQRRLLSCTAAELRDLAGFIERILPDRDRQERQDLEDAMTKRGEVLERREVGTWTYCRQRVKCGKPTCHCAKDAGHGPYWYAYRSQGGKTVSRYIGKELRRLWKDQPDSQASPGQSDGE